MNNQLRKILNRWIFLIIMIPGITCVLRAQFDDVNFEWVSAKFGMPNDVIFSMVQDDFGYLWVGTGEGLFRFDGYEFKAYRHDVHDSTSISHPYISSLHCDNDGNIWAGSTYGLNLMDRRTETFLEFQPFPEEGRKQKATNSIRKIFQDSQDNFWISGRSSLYRFNRSPDRFSFIKMCGNPDARYIVTTFYEDPNGMVWFGTSSGLMKLDLSDTTCQLSLVYPDTGISDRIIITGLCGGGDGTLWMSTPKGLIHWDPTSGRVIEEQYPADLVEARIESMMKDSKGNLWMSIYKNGIYVFHPPSRQFRHFFYIPNQTTSLQDNNVTCLLEDSFQNIWIGMVNGLSKVKLYDSGYHLYQNERGYENTANEVLRIFQDSRGGLYTKTPEGVYYMATAKARSGKMDELDVSKKEVTRGSFLEDRDGSVWFSISGEGLYRRKIGDERFIQLPVGEKLKQSGINKMLIDPVYPDYFWIGTTEGLCRFNRLSMEEQWFEPRDQLQEVVSNQIIIFDLFGKDEIWMYYTYSNSMGCFNLRTGDFSIYRPSPDEQVVLEGDIKDIAIGKDGNIWLATLYGLSNFNIHTKAFALFGEREGLQESVLASVLIDSLDQVWVSGNRFFAHFDPVEKSFTNYSITRDIRHFVSKSRFLGNDGSVMLGSINGIFAFHPEKIKRNLIKPKLVLTDFRVKNESYLLDRAFEETANIVLSYDENDVAFSFSGLHYINPEGNTYRCQLVGFENSWRDLGNEHKVSYTNLNSGKYTFRAIVANSDNVWNEEGLTIQLTILPAYWQTIWFKSLILLILSSIGYAVFKNRQHQQALQRQKEMAEQSAAYKTRFLADVSHEIRTPMNAIIGLSKLALDTPLNEKQFKFIDAIRKSSQNLLAIINDLLDHTKLEAGKFTFVNKPFQLKDLIAQIDDIHRHQAESKGLEFTIDVDPAIPNDLMGDPVRLMQILTNLIGNAIKFTKAGKVWLTLESRNHRSQKASIHFTVGDTGIGIASDQLEHIFESYNQAQTDHSLMVEGTGLGLNIARQLVERQGGQLSLDSKPGKGTILQFLLEFERSETTELVKEAIKPIRTLPGMRLLLVEDNEFNRLLILEILEKYMDGPVVDIAENGKVALEILEDQSYDIVIMDVKMPVMDGYETARRIRQSANEILRQIPILAVTASAIPAQLEKCLEAGMNAHVTKPVDEIKLIEKIYELTKREERIDRVKLKTMLANDENRVERFLSIFKTQTPELLERIRVSMNSGDWEQVSIAAHTLKSQCQFLGLSELAELALEVEETAGGIGDKHNIEIRVEQLERDLQQVIQHELS